MWTISIDIIEGFMNNVSHLRTVGYVAQVCILAFAPPLYTGFHRLGYPWLWVPETSSQTRRIHSLCHFLCIFLMLRAAEVVDCVGLLSKIYRTLASHTPHFLPSQHKFSREVHHSFGCRHFTTSHLSTWLSLPFFLPFLPLWFSSRGI